MRKRETRPATPALRRCKSACAPIAIGHELDKLLASAARLEFDTASEAAGPLKNSGLARFRMTSRM
jgi:hypothetical protein